MKPFNYRGTFFKDPFQACMLTIKMEKHILSISHYFHNTVDIEYHSLSPVKNCLQLRKMLMVQVGIQ